MVFRQTREVVNQYQSPMARQNRKGKERRENPGKGNGLSSNQEVVCRNPIEAFIGVRKGKRENEESRRSVGGHEQVLTESSPNGGHLGLSMVRPLSTGRSNDRPVPGLPLSTSRGADRPGTTRPPQASTRWTCLSDRHLDLTRSGVARDRQRLFVTLHSPFLPF